MGFDFPFWKNIAYAHNFPKEGGKQYCIVQIDSPSSTQIYTHKLSTISAWSVFRHIAPHWPTVKTMPNPGFWLCYAFGKGSGDFPVDNRWFSWIDYVSIRAIRSVKQKGILGLGAFVLKSKKMLVLWSTAILYKTVVSLAWKLSLKRVSIETNLFQQNYTTLKMNKVNWPMWLESVGIFMLA